jgi:hypothetical protein
MRIKLASWYGDKAPGEEIDVDDATAKALSRDGLVAEAVEAIQEEPPSEPAAAEPTSKPETGRRKR